MVGAAGPNEERDRKGAPLVSPGDTLLGKYRVERVLGEGSMGTIFAARHLESGEVYALKVLSAKALASSQATPRFLREARALARLRGPHVATVHEIARLPTGAPCMVMEYLRGSDLQEILARGVPPLRDALDWMIQACDGVAQAHASDIVHRDIKPANLFVSPLPGGRSQVRVLDFGIAKLAEPDGPLDNELTQAGMVFGSPSYMSPEQMRQTKDVDGRTDVWALGVVLYEMLTGTLPFSPAAGPMDLVLRIAGDTPARPIELRPDLPPALDAAVMRCLEKKRERRFQTAAELADALRAVLATLPADNHAPPAPVPVSGGAPPGATSVSGGAPPGATSVSGAIPPAPPSARGAIVPGPISVRGAAPQAPASVSGGIPPAPVSGRGGEPPGTAGSALPVSSAVGPVSAAAPPSRRRAPRWALVAAAVAVVAIAGAAVLLLWPREAETGEPQPAQGVSSTASGAPAPSAEGAPDPSAAPSPPAASASPSASRAEPTASAPTASAAPSPARPVRPVRPVRSTPPKSKVPGACSTTADCGRGKRCIQGTCK